jgi:hypothetical protein
MICWLAANLSREPYFGFKQTWRNPFNMLLFKQERIVDRKAENFFSPLNFI